MCVTGDEEGSNEEEMDADTKAYERENYARSEGRMEERTDGLMEGRTA